MKTYTIIDLATDKEYTDTIPNLLEMVENCNNTEPRDYDIVIYLLAKTIRVNFEYELKNSGLV